MSLVDLMKLKVTSVSKHEQPLLDAPAAITVLRGEDLRRAGATSIVEGLRTVPGVQVARIDANKLLVVNDGRSVYTPLFSGVHWAEQDAILQDLERVEVIRGPGATLWGANAVDGVIQITSKSARDTQGGLVEPGGGTQERLLTAARWGGRIDEDAWYRVYARYADRDDGHNIAVLPGPTPITILGTHRYGAEELLACELGYRVLPAPGLSFDLALFYNEYDDLRTAEPRAFAPFPPFPATLSVLDNKMGGRSFGAELAAGWQAADTQASEVERGVYATRSWRF